MTKFASVLLAALVGSAIASPAAPPTVTQAPDLDKRVDIEPRAVTSTCTFSGATGAAAASASKTLCATIILSNVAVPSGVPLDLSGLNDNTHVRFSPQYAHFFSRKLTFRN